MHVDGAGGGDHSFAVTHGRCRRDQKARIDAVHNCRITGLTKADDAAVFDSEVAFDNADYRVDDQHITQQHIESALCAGHAGGKPDTVAQRLAAAVQALIAINGVIFLHDGNQRRVGEPDAVAHRRAVQSRIVSARNRDHGEPSRAFEAGLAGAP